MKKSCLYSVLLAAAFGVVAISPKLMAVNSPASSCCGAPVQLPTCCGATTEAMADETKAKPDLLSTCPVSGEKLGKMGKPLVFTYKEQEVKLCCTSCKTDFDKDPEKYLAKIRAADKK